MKLNSQQTGFASEEDFQEELAMLHRDYPNLSRTQLLEAKENLDRYFDLAVRIFLRLEKEKAEKNDLEHPLELNQ
jgi:hypothetical protein